METSCLKLQFVNYNQGNESKEREADDDVEDSGKNRHRNERKCKRERCLEVSCSKGK